MNHFQLQLTIGYKKCHDRNSFFALRTQAIEWIQNKPQILSSKNSAVPKILVNFTYWMEVIGLIGSDNEQIDSVK